jgi:hypothetical protein
MKRRDMLCADQYVSPFLCQITRTALSEKTIISPYAHRGKRSELGFIDIPGMSIDNLDDRIRISVIH